MPKFKIKYCFTGNGEVDIEAENEEEARDKFKGAKSFFNNEWGDDYTIESVDVDNTCPKCGVIHDVEEAGGHDLIEANKVLLCECAEHPDDEFCAQVLEDERKAGEEVCYCQDSELSAPHLVKDH